MGCLMVFLITFINCQVAAWHMKGNTLKNLNPKEHQTLMATKQCLNIFIFLLLSIYWGTEWIQCWCSLSYDIWKYNALVKSTNSVAHHCLFLSVESQQMTDDYTMFPCTPCGLNCVTAALLFTLSLGTVRAEQHSSSSDRAQPDRQHEAPAAQSIYTLNGSSGIPQSPL